MGSLIVSAPMSRGPLPELRIEGATIDAAVELAVGKPHRGIHLTVSP